MMIEKNLNNRDGSLEKIRFIKKEFKKLFSTNSEKLRRNLTELRGKVIKIKIYKKEIRKIIFNKFRQNLMEVLIQI